MIHCCISRMQPKPLQHKPEHLKDFSACYLLTGFCSPSVSRCHGGGSRGAGCWGMDGCRPGWTVRCHVYRFIDWSIDYRERCCCKRDQRSPPEWWIAGAFSLDSQTKCQPHLCVFVMRRWMCPLAPAQHVQIKILTLNKRPRPARCAPVIIRSLPREDTLTFKFGGWGGFFLWGLTQRA